MRPRILVALASLTLVVAALAAPPFQADTFKAGNGTAAAPSYTFTTNSTTGFSFKQVGGDPAAVCSASGKDVAWAYSPAGFDQSVWVVVRDTNDDGTAEGALNLLANGSAATGASNQQLPNSGVVTAGGTGGLVLISNTGAPIIFNTDGTATTKERMRITSDGKVGIGTTSPDWDLSVKKTVGASGFVLNGTRNLSPAGSAQVFSWADESANFLLLESGGSTFAGGTVPASTSALRTAATGGLNVVSQGAAPIRFLTSGAAAANERMRIDSDGKVGIGTTIPTSKLAVQDSVTTTVRSWAESDGNVTGGYQAFAGTTAQVALNLLCTGAGGPGTSLLTLPNTCRVNTGSAIQNDLIVSSPHANGKIQFATGGSATSNERLRIPNDGGLRWNGIATASAPAVSATDTAQIYYDSTLDKFRCSVEGGAYGDCTQGFASGSGSVTSVDASVPTQEFAVSGVPITSSGTIAFTRKAAFSAGNITGATTINWNNGITQTATLIGNVTLTFSNPLNGGWHCLALTQDATGSRTVSWPGSVVSAPSVASSANAETTACFVFDGTTYYGNVPGGNAPKWSQLANPDGATTLSMGALATAFNWTSDTSAISSMFSLADSTGNTAGGPVLSVSTTGTSVAKPLRFTAKGTSNGVEMTNAGKLQPIGSGTVTATQADAAFFYTNVISPTSFSAQQDNYAPTGIATASVVRVTPTGGSVNMTGIDPGTSPTGRMLRLVNIGTVNLVLKNDVTSTAANRFLFPVGDVTVLPNASVTLIYDGTSSRWRNASTLQNVRTQRMPTLGWSTTPDTSGNVFLEPYPIKATNDVWKHSHWIFSDADNCLYTMFNVPKGYVDGAKWVIVWTTTATSGNAKWEIAYRTVAGDDSASLDQTGTEQSQTVVDAAPTATDRRLETSVTPTAANFAADETVEARICRTETATNDTINGVAIQLVDLIFEWSGT